MFVALLLLTRKIYYEVLIFGVILNYKISLTENLCITKIAGISLVHGPVVP